MAVLQAIGVGVAAAFAFVVIVYLVAWLVAGRPRFWTQGQHHAGRRRDW